MEEGDISTDPCKTFRFCLFFFFLLCNCISQQDCNSSLLHSRLLQGGLGILRSNLYDEISFITRTKVVIFNCSKVVRLLQKSVVKFPKYKNCRNGFHTHWVKIILN